MATRQFCDGGEKYIILKLKTIRSLKIKDKEVIAKTNSEESKGGTIEKLDYLCNL